MAIFGSVAYFSRKSLYQLSVSTDEDALMACTVNFLNNLKYMIEFSMLFLSVASREVPDQHTFLKTHGSSATQLVGAWLIC